MRRQKELRALLDLRTGNTSAGVIRVSDDALLLFKICQITVSRVRVGIDDEEETGEGVTRNESFVCWRR